MAFLAYHISKRSRDIVKQNLDFAFDSKMGKKEIDEITRYSFKNLLFNFMHLMELRYMSEDELRQKVTLQNKDAVNRVHKEGRAVIYVTTHYCSWELGGASLGVLVEPLAAVYKQMKDKDFENWLLESRASFSNTNLEKAKVIKPLIKLIKQGKASGILIDTNINQREGVEVEFMAKKIRQTSTPAYLARKYNAAIIPVTIRTDDEDNYTLMLFDEIPIEHTDDEAADIQKCTQLQADWLTKLITDEPKFWFWLHRRWKNEYPQIYKKG